MPSGVLLGLSPSQEGGNCTASSLFFCHSCTAAFILLSSPETTDAASSAWGSFDSAARYQTARSCKHPGYSVEALWEEPFIVLKTNNAHLPWGDKYARPKHGGREHGSGTPGPSFPGVLEITCDS